MKHIPPIYNYPVEEYKLVFIDGNKAYFSTNILIAFDDWMDSPYMYASPPQEGDHQDYTITSLYFEVNMFTPSELEDVCYNTYYINEGNVPWLRTAGWMDGYREIMAGTTMRDFITQIISFNGNIWVNYNQLSDKKTVDILRKYVNISNNVYLANLINEL